ncbi:hypothetical protein CK203_006338 [Vitis vinifera]|uniref:Uncharacterized protein n=1 Tax=Vitis vinifera TaxID=29760 RepID=A0A438KAU7_VITVI|nr:hypothetical protein CK203_006338 [Vitis vinifera]
MVVVESLVEYKMRDSSKPKPQSKGSHAKGGGDKGSRGYTPKEGSSKTYSGKDVPRTPQSKGLMYVKALINGKATKALVDIGATHNFVSDDETKRLEL